VSGPGLDLGRLPEVTAALAGRAEEHDRAGSFPADGIGIVHAAGLLTATVSERYGGPGAGLAQTVAILHALGRGDPSVALIAAIGAVEQAVALVGNNGLTRKYPLERHYRDVLCARVHTPQDDSVVTAAGQSALSPYCLLDQSVLYELA
jgi:alkylation response protein AidB-like acyl-CoA dehydrogenase